MSSQCCSGCGLCAAVSGGAIKMTVSDDGFLRPQQNRPVATDTDSLIADICPGIGVVQGSRLGEDHLLWGPLIDVRTGHSTDPALRHHASSGGALSAIAKFLIDIGVVDRVVQTAAAAEAPLENKSVISRDGEDIYQAAGSRYAPSAPLAGLVDELEKSGRFALVGKPCDIAAVRALARHDERVEERIPVMLSFFCAGIPSIKGARRILKELSVAEKDVVRFRYRGDGWPGRAAALLRDGREIYMSYAASWGEVLSKHVQFRCKICPDGSGGLADIVFADAWHCDEKGYPLFEEEDGRSLIVTRSELGERLVQEAIEKGSIAAESMDADEITFMQPSQANRKRLVASRLAAMTVLRKYVPSYTGFNLLKAALSASIGANIKSFMGTARRIVLKRW